MGYWILVLLSIITKSISVNAQENMKKVSLEKGLEQTVVFQDLKVNTLLQVYDQDDQSHLHGDMSIRVNDSQTGKMILSYYLDKDDTVKQARTYLYKNYFLTLEIDKKMCDLQLEESKIGITFILGSNPGVIKDLDIEIIDSFHEWGSEGPLGGETFNFIHQTIKITLGAHQQKFSFYDYEIKDDFFIDFEGFRIIPLTVDWQPHLIEMKIENIL